MKNKVIAISAVFFLIILGTVALRAEDNEPQPGVARVSVIHGDVSTQRGDSGDWVAASINTPLVAGDWVLTGTKSRTEVQLDYANVLRMSEEAEAKIAELSRTKIQVQVRRGLINFDVFKGTEADVEIDTPNMAVRPVGEGTYRVLVVSDEETQVIVRKGEADVTTPQGSTTVKKGDLITIRGRENPEYQVSSAPGKDAWDDWNSQRDGDIVDARSYERTNRYYTGVSDLDRNGRWIYITDYGWVWTPYGGPDWAPYRYGRWVWEPYWGWTWASYEPWGWAPYHYGRWFIHAGYWCWWPGPVHAFYRPIWAPAYVAFFGWGHHSGFSFGFGFGNIGWLPIGPGDYYYPWWGGHRRNINVINITNINITNINRYGGMGPLHRGGPGGRGSNLTRVLNDPNLRRGMTAMPTGDFGRRAVPRTGRPAVTPADLREGRMVAGNIPVVPTRESLRTVDRPASVPRNMGGAARSERFFTRSQPTYRPQPFQTEAAEVRSTLERRQAENRAGQGNDNNRLGNRPGAAAEDRSPNAGGSVNARPGTRANIDRPAERPGAANTPNTEGTPAWRRFGGNQPRTESREAQVPSERTPTRRTVDRPAARPQREAQPQERTAPETRTPSRPATDSSRPGWRTFEPQDRTRTREQAPAREASPDTAPRRTTSTSEERPGFRPFTPQPDRAERSTSRDDSMGGGRSFPSSRGTAESGGRGSAERSSRPPLDFDRPIVEPRGGGSRPDVRSGGSRPEVRGGGGYGGSRPEVRSGGGYGGSRPEVRGGGGGGGGSRPSAPSGGRSGGSSTPPSRPSGGGGARRH